MLGDDLFQGNGVTAQVLDLVRGRGPRCVTRQPALAGFQEFLRPAVINIAVQPFTAAQFCDTVFTAKAFKIRIFSSAE